MAIMKGKSKITGSGVFPDSEKTVSGEIVGIKDTGYLTDKGLDAGANAEYNYLPPGENIDDQKNADIRKMDFVEYNGGCSFPDDGWS